MRFRSIFLLPTRRGPRSARLLRRSAAIATASAFVFTGAVVAAPAANAVDPVRINIVTINDLRGRIEQQLPYGPGGGIAELATAFKYQRIDDPNTIVASAGDNIGGSTFTSYILQDEPTIDTLNMAGLDVSAVGDHEFERGFSDLTGRIIPQADFPYLAANVYDTSTGEPALQQYSIEERSGVRVAFVGAVTTDLPRLVRSSATVGIEAREIAPELNRVAAQLSDGDESNDEAEVVIALVHEGATGVSEAAITDPSAPLGRILDGLSADIDMVATGHTQLVYSRLIDGRPVTQDGKYGEYVQNTAFDYYPDTGEIQWEDTITTPMWERYSTGTSRFYPDDPAVAAVVSDAVADAAAAGQERIGGITADINRGRQPGFADPAVPTESWGAESTLGNFVADAQLRVVQRDLPKTRLSLVRPGSLAADLTFSGEEGSTGDVTHADAAAVSPAANDLLVVTLTGQQLKDVLEQQWRPPDSSWPMIKLGVGGGLTYVADFSRPIGSRIVSLAYQGSPVNLNNPFTVVVDSVLAAGGDGFTAMAQATARRGTGVTDLGALTDWFDEGTFASPFLNQRSVGMRVIALGQGGLRPGAPIRIDLSSLDYTTNEPSPMQGGVRWWGFNDVTWSSEIDRTRAQGTDETGRASVFTTIPADARGTTYLSISTRTGTDIRGWIHVQGEPFQRADTTTLGWPSTVAASPATKVSYTVQVKVPGRPASGEATIYDGSRALMVVSLTGAPGGRITVTLPKLSRGLHSLWVRYEGSQLYNPSDSPRTPLLIL
jgi:5'-nucleotidase